MHKEFSNKKYNLMMFDNILQYYKKIPSLDNIGSINRYIKEKLVPMLEDDGKIQVCYGFEVVADAVKELLHLEKVEKLNDINDLFMKYGIERDKKEGFIANIVKKYGVYENSLYSLDFIRAVEEVDGHMTSKNVILTYQPKRK